MHIPSQDTCVIQVTENQAVKLLKTTLLNTPTCIVNLTIVFQLDQNIE